MPDPTRLTIKPAVTLGEDEVHLWHVNLNDRAWLGDDLVDTLSDEERDRAQHFRFPMHRQRFIASHGIQRLLLANYAGQAPRDLRFAYGRHGKPALTCCAGPPLLRFNIAHSQNLLLCAVAGTKEVGVDVECQRPLLDLTGLAKSAFTKGEFARFAQAKSSEKKEHFFRIWTCKEAYLKATGEGISGLSTIDINLQKNEESSFSTHFSTIESWQRTWSIYSFSPAEGFAAALAVEGRLPRISHMKQLLQ